MSVKFSIRPALPADLPEIFAIYARARDFMKETGNPNQWSDKWPPEDLVREDVRLGRSFVCEAAGRVEGVFMLQSGLEPSYAVLEDGTWQSDAPYHTIHRIAASGRVHGVFSFCIRWCHARCGYLRIDTHADNKVMQHLILKNGFRRAGIVHLDDGTDRIAYDLLPAEPDPTGGGAPWTRTNTSGWP